MKKICITGKGGSGKSMLSVLLARSLAAKGYSPLIVDADESNLGLQHMLGIDTPPKPLMAYLGGKSGIQQKMMAAFSRGSDEPKMEAFGPSPIHVSDIPPECIARAGTVGLVTVGKIERSMEGCACPMGVLAKDFLSKLTGGERDVAISDHEAGLEHFGRGVEMGVDSVVVIVEPSFESVLLAEKIHALAAEMGVRSIAVLNKMTPEVKEDTRAALAARGIAVSCAIDYDPVVFKACLSGQPLTGTQAEKLVAGLVEALGL